MKREIKFRAWDKKDKVMVDVASINFWPDGVLSVLEDVDDAEPQLADSYELMQYTGLTDKNGQKIYEGDLFEHRFGYVVLDEPPHDEIGTECGVVVLEDGQFGVKIQGLGVYNLYGLLLREGHLDNMPKDDLFVMKIAGNIYENPELLEGKQ